MGKLPTLKCKYCGAIHADNMSKHCAKHKNGKHLFPIIIPYAQSLKFTNGKKVDIKYSNITIGLVPAVD